MGKQTLEQKADIVAAVGSALDSAEMVLVIDYKGLTMSEMNEFRAELRKVNSSCTVVKNTLMRRAIADRPTWAGLDPFLAGSSAFVMIREDIKKSLKAYEDFQKKLKKTEFKGAAIDGLSLDIGQAKAIADLPPKEELMAQVAGSLNSLTTKLAVGINAVPTQVVTVVNEIPASVGRAIQAIASKDEGQDAEAA